MTKQQLIQMQNLPLEVKVLKSKQRIREFYEHYQGNVYISFSGGKDSTVLLDLVRSVYPHVPAVFADTGLEYPEIREFVRTFDNVTWVKPEKHFKQVIEEDGYPVISKQNALYIRQAQTLPKDSRSYKLRMEGWNEKRQEYGHVGKIPDKWKHVVDSGIKVSEKCCNYMKKKPFRNYEKENGNPKPFIGQMAEESQNRQKQYMKKGCNSFDGKEQSNPMGFWTEQDVLKYIKENNLPYASVYGEIFEVDGKLKTTGEERTGCMFCMFGVHMEESPNRFQRMKHTHPKMYEYCFKPKSEGGLELQIPLKIIGINWRDEDEDQITMDEALELAREGKLNE